MLLRMLMLGMALAIAAAGTSVLFGHDVSAKRVRLKPTPCTVEPRVLEDDSGQASATPTPPGATGSEVDVIVDSLDDLPQGETAQLETTAEIEATLQEYAGCVNSGSSLQVAALMTDKSLAYLGGLGALVEGLDSQRTDDTSGREAIKWISVSDVRILPTDQVGALVDMGFEGGDRGSTYTPPVFYIFELVDGRWLLDGQLAIEAESDVTSNSESLSTPAALDDAALRKSARNGFSEVDSAMYAEPTMAGAKFSLEAMVMVGFLDEDDYAADIGCEIFIFERGAVSATVSAYCRADPALAGRAAYLDVKAQGPLRSASFPLYACEDLAPLAESIVFSCTVELPPETRK